MKQNALLYTKTTLVRFLRGYIHNAENYEHLLNDKITVDDIKQLQIYDTTPDTLISYPISVISGSNGDIQPLGLGDFKQEQYNQFGDVIGYLYGGTYTFNLTLELATLSSYHTEFISDFLVNALRIYLYRKLEAKGILITSVKYNSDSTLMDKNNVVFLSNIGLSVWNQWNYYVDLLDIKNVNIDID